MDRRTLILPPIEVLKVQTRLQSVSTYSEVIDFLKILNGKMAANRAPIHGALWHQLPEMDENGPHFSR